MQVPVTLEDVRMALGSDDPRQSNAAVIRQRLGRGSFGTIQKHLVKLREELERRDRPVNHQQESTPPMPDEVLNGFRAAWTAAHLFAERQYAQQVAQLEAERDALAAELATASADLDAAAATIEAAEEAAQRAEEARAEAEEARQRAEEARNAAEEAEAAARQQLAVVEARAERDQAVLRAELERLIQQLADYRAALMAGRAAGSDG
jgi:DNA repair exonuclease SbcCD ATPase subunit